MARHRDRYRYAGVEPEDSDLPADCAANIRKVDVGGTLRMPLSGKPDVLAATVMARDEYPAAGYLPLLYALRHGAEKQGDLAALASLAEPYERPHADDGAFYAQPRLVSHLDAAAAEQWREFSRRFVADGTAVLDLMASCDSHLPPQARPAALVGLGMNAAELEANPGLSERIVHDLNRHPLLPCESARFDVALCALSIEYLVRPVAVLSDVRRCLKPGGTCVISFSERWFPPKAVMPWPQLHPFARVAWVVRHLRDAGFVALATESLRGLPRPPDDKYAGQTAFADPLYAVWGFAPG